MAGLIKQSMQAEAQPQTQPMGGQPAQGAGQEGQMPKPSPEQQEMYERFVLSAAKVIYDDNANQSIVQRLEAGKDTPAETLTQTARTIVNNLRERGGDVPPIVVAEGSEEILSMLAELADKAGIFEVDQDVVDETSQQMAKTLMSELQQQKPSGGGQPTAQQPGQPPAQPARQSPSQPPDMGA